MWVVVLHLVMMLLYYDNIKTEQITINIVVTSSCQLISQRVKQ